MKCHFYNKEHKQIDTKDLTPICGEDFCDICGDCLCCCGGDSCYDGSEESSTHCWVVYVDDIEEPIEEFIKERAKVETNYYKGAKWAKR